MNLMNDVLKLISQFVGVGGGIWLLWGAVVLGVGLRNHSGPDIQSGIWQIVGGGLILAAAVLFATVALK